MGSQIITFRVPDDLYELFMSKCADDGHTPSEKLRKFVDDYCYLPKAPATPTLEGKSSPEGTPSADEGSLDFYALEVYRLEVLTARVEVLETTSKQMNEVLVTLQKTAPKPEAQAPKAEAVKPSKAAKKRGIFDGIIFKAEAEEAPESEAKK